MKILSVLFCIIFTITTFSNASSQGIKYPSDDIAVGEPTIVFEAEKAEKWGFVQFPRIARIDDNLIVVAWNMAEDNIKSKTNIDWRYSKNNGKTWYKNKKQRPLFGGTIIGNGDELRFVSTKEDAKKLTMPQSDLTSIKETTKQKYTFYKSSTINKTYNTFQMLRRKKGNEKYDKEFVYMEDPIGYRYTLDGIFPKQAWGKIIVANDNELLKANYPFYEKKNDKIQPSGISVFSSTDNGKSWKLKSYVSYEGDTKNRTVSGFQEPDISRMPNGDILMVMRTSIGSKSGEMFSTISKDNGLTWSNPKVIADNGVLPQLLVLENGIVILSSGRPGVQVRLSRDNGKSWSKPIEIVENNTEKMTSCGYTGLMEVEKNKFMIVYSNFMHKNKDGQYRKSIEVREIIIDK